MPQKIPTLALTVAPGFDDFDESKSYASNNNDPTIETIEISGATHMSSIILNNRSKNASSTNTRLRVATSQRQHNSAVNNKPSTTSLLNTTNTMDTMNATNGSESNKNALQSKTSIFYYYLKKFFSFLFNC